jgi:cytochrome c oxidase cbb3-type subunit 3
MCSVCKFAALGLVAAVLISCQEPPADTAVTGATPTVTVPVGPLPGPTPAPVLNDNPFHDAVARQQGRDLFVRFNCSGCHGGHGGGGMGPSLRDPVWLYGNSDAHVFDSIAQGRGQGMPSWAEKIPQEQVWQLVAYVKSLNTPDEPDRAAE